MDKETDFSCSFIRSCLIVGACCVLLGVVLGIDSFLVDVVGGKGLQVWAKVALVTCMLLAQVVLLWGLGRWIRKKVSVR